MPRGKTILATLLSAVALSGCAVFQSPPTASQNQLIGSVRVSVTVCASQHNSPPPGSCTNEGNSHNNASTDPSQLYLGFRVPAGAGAPQSFNSSTTGPNNTGPQLHFTQSVAYTSELQRLAPVPSGEKWVGYTSQYVTYNKTSGEQNFSASVDLGLPKHPDGSPFSGPFTYRVVVGGRQFRGSGTPDPKEPIDCGNTLTAPASGSNDWICVDDPSQATLATDVSLTTRDAGIEPGSPVKARRGRTAKVPFKFGYAGSATQAASFTFTATTNLSGAKPSSSVTTLTPAANSTTPVSVSVPIPKHARPGTYTVTLTARLNDGELRTGTGTLVIPASCRVPGLSGKTVHGARPLLKHAHCRLGRVQSAHNSTTKGQIFSQHPAKGKVLPAGSSVSVTVSLGP